MRPSLNNPAFTAIAIAAIMMLFSSFQVIEPGFRGVSVTLGTLKSEFIGEGLAFKKPFIEKIVSIPVKQITIASVAETFSSDLQTVIVKYSVLYRIPESQVVTLYRGYLGDPYEKLVEPRVQESLKEVTAAYRAEEVVKRRTEVKTKVLEKLRAALGDLIYIQDVTINNIDLSKELEKAIETKQVMEQQALAKVYELQKAVREAEIVIVNAKAEGESVEIKGKAIKAAPEVIQLEIVKKWDGRSPQTVVTGHGGSNILLPLK